MILLIAGASHMGKTLPAQRLLDDSGLSKEELLRENRRNLDLCREKGYDYILIEDTYHIPLEGILP